MQDSILIMDCNDIRHTIKIDNIKNFSSNTQKTITTVHLKELENNFWDIKTYESEDPIRLRYSKLYDTLHKEI